MKKTHKGRTYEIKKNGRGAPLMKWDDLMVNGRWKSDEEIEELYTLGKNGQPPKLKTIIQRVLNQVSNGNADPSLVTILRKQIQKAEAGDTKSAEFLLNRAYGLPVQTIDNMNPPVAAIQINIVEPRSNGKSK